MSGTAQIQLVVVLEEELLTAAAALESAMATPKDAPDNQAGEAVAAALMTCYRALWHLMPSRLPDGCCVALGRLNAAKKLKRTSGDELEPPRSTDSLPEQGGGQK